VKKVLFTLALVAATIGSAAAQGFSYGLKAGANYANLWGKNRPSSSGYAFGFLGGVAVNYAFNDMASLQIEGLFSQKGYKVSDGDYTDANNIKYKADVTQKLQYVDVPVLAHVKAGPLFFEAGPQIGLLVNSRIKNSSKVKNGDDTVSESSYALADDAIIGYNKTDRNNGAIPHFDMGVIAGVGYNITPALSLGVRYNAGLKTLVDSKDTKAGAEPHLFNNAFQAQVGWMFGANKM
jgi:Outer membrane protein beta-barrel domain